MILNFDRRRIYIFGSVGLVLLLLIAFYHAPSYVPTEVSRMKTSVSTWLKGTEPSLSDETYKDSPHFDNPTKAQESEPVAQQHTKTTHSAVDHSQDDAPPLQIVGDDNIDMLPPNHVSSEAPSPTTSKLLPHAEDFIAVLPPVNVVSSMGDVSSASVPTSSVNEHSYSLPEPSSPAGQATYSLPQLTSSVGTTLVTHISSAAPSATEPAELAFDEDKWAVDE